MSKAVFLVLAIVLVLGIQAEASYGKGHSGTLGSQGYVSGLGLSGQGGGQYGQGGHVNHASQGSLGGSHGPHANQDSHSHGGYGHH